MDQHEERPGKKRGERPGGRNRERNANRPESRRERPPARKALGQNYLQDANLAAKIVRLLEIGPEDPVLEIGPGPGALSGFIAAHAPARYVLVEKDRRWAVERMRGGQGLSVLLADALRLPFERFGPGWKFIGNLPYNIASPLMWDLFSRTAEFAKAVFMVQKEVAFRVTARPGNGEYGALSVWLQSFTFPKLEFVVPPQVFFPRPKVDSAVLSFLPRRERDFDPPALDAALKACFQMRRKQLGGIARAAGQDPGALEKIGIDPKLRPENLSPADFHKLAGAGLFNKTRGKLF